MIICMRKAITIFMTGLFLFGLTSPAFADSFGSEYPNCASLDGFVTNADDSTGDAKICLTESIDTSIIDTPKPGVYTLEEISEYCSQFDTRSDFENDCVDDYITIDESRERNFNFGIGFILLGVGLITWFIGFILLVFIDNERWNMSTSMLPLYLTVGGIGSALLSVIPLALL